MAVASPPVSSESPAVNPNAESCREGMRGRLGLAELCRPGTQPPQPPSDSVIQATLFSFLCLPPGLATPEEAGAAADKWDRAS